MPRSHRAVQHAMPPRSQFPRTDPRALTGQGLERRFKRGNHTGLGLCSPRNKQRPSQRPNSPEPFSHSLLLPPSPPVNVRNQKEARHRRRWCLRKGVFCPQPLLPTTTRRGGSFSATLTGSCVCADMLVDRVLEGHVPRGERLAAVAVCGWRADDDDGGRCMCRLCLRTTLRMSRSTASMSS